MRSTDDSRQNQDALELLSEAKVLVLSKLQRSPQLDGSVRDLDAYVKTVTANVFNQYLRRKYPRRLSLKNQLRYLLTHHERLALWQQNDQWICGMAASRESSGVELIALTAEQRADLLSRVSSSKRTGRDIIEFALGVFEMHS